MSKRKRVSSGADDRFAAAAAMVADAAKDASAPFEPSPEEAAAQTDKLVKKKKKRGVVYVAKVPPYMKPAKLRHILEQHGKVTNMHFTQEDESVRHRRRKNGGSKKPKFKEAWFEFKQRKVAKRVALTLNNTKFGRSAGPKSGYWHDDLWNLKYLPKFTWEHLTEKREHEKHVREHRLRVELDQVRRDNEFFLERVAESKKFSKMEERKVRRARCRRRCCCCCCCCYTSPLPPLRPLGVAPPSRRRRRTHSHSRARWPPTRSPPRSVRRARSPRRTRGRDAPSSSGMSRQRGWRGRKRRPARRSPPAYSVCSRARSEARRIARLRATATPRPLYNKLDPCACVIFMQRAPYCRSALHRRRACACACCCCRVVCWRLAHVKHVVASNEYLPQVSREGAVDVLLRAGEL